jgi:hypothetical protein
LVEDPDYHASPFSKAGFPVLRFHDDMLAASGEETVDCNGSKQVVTRLNWR